jgi:hypothetical protein
MADGLMTSELHSMESVTHHSCTVLPDTLPYPSVAACLLLVVAPTDCRESTKSRASGCALTLLGSKPSTRTPSNDRQRLSATYACPHSKTCTEHTNTHVHAYQ